jgi:hypothetical protein
VREQYLLDWSMNDCLRQEKDEWLVSFAKGFGERQGRSSLASHLRFACEIGAVLGVFSQASIAVE